MEWYISFRKLFEYKINSQKIIELVILTNKEYNYEMKEYFSKLTLSGIGNKAFGIIL